MINNIIYAIAEMFGVFAIGAVARHWKYIEEKDLTDWSKFTMDFLFPLLIFASIIKDFRVERFSELWILPVIGFGLMLFGAIVGIGLRFGLKSKDPAIKATFMHFCAANNYSFLPIIVLTNLWPDNGYLPLLFILNIGSTVGYWTIGIVLLGSHDMKKTMQNILSPTIVSIVIALVIALCGLRNYVPDLLLKICTSLGNAAVPIIFVIIGASLYGSPKLTKNKWDITWLTIARLLIIPALSIVILKLLPLTQDVFNVAFIVAIMPVSVSSVIMTRIYGGSPDFAGQAALVTTIASVATIPAFLCLLEKLPALF